MQSISTGRSNNLTTYIHYQEHNTSIKLVADRRTDRPTDIATYRAAIAAKKVLMLLLRCWVKLWLWLWSLFTCWLYCGCGCPILILLIPGLCWLHWKSVVIICLLSIKTEVILTPSEPHPHDPATYGLDRSHLQPSDYKLNTSRWLAKTFLYSWSHSQLSKTSKTRRWA